jgi:hypothetical protein
MLSKFPKLIAVTGMVGALAACNGRDITATVPTLPHTTAPVAAPLVLRDTNWQIITAADLRRMADELEANPGQQITLYALDDDGFDALNLNLIDIRRFILEQQQIIKFYEDLEEATHPSESADAESEN